MDSPTPPRPATAEPPGATRDARAEPPDELETLRANFHAHIEARIHDVGTISNLVRTLRQVLDLVGSTNLSPRTVARLRTLTADQLRRYEHGACGCDRCVSAVQEP